MLLSLSTSAVAPKAPDMRRKERRLVFMPRILLLSRYRYAVVNVRLGSGRGAVDRLERRDLRDRSRQRTSRRIGVADLLGHSHPLQTDAAHITLGAARYTTGYEDAARRHSDCGVC